MTPVTAASPVRMLSGRSGAPAPTRLPRRRVVPVSAVAAPVAPSMGADQRALKSGKVGGKTVVITGGSQGCGRALALLFAQEGYNVVVAARTPDRLDKVAQECSAIASKVGAGSHLAIPTDVTQASDVATLAARVAESYETIDLVVNNAGVCLRGNLEDTAEEDFRAQMDINFFGPMLVSKAFSEPLKRAAAATQGPRGPKPTLLMVNSFAGRLPVKQMSAYTASKFALAGFTDSVRAELAPHGVAVVQVHPGVVASDFMERAQFRGETAEKDTKQMADLLASGGGGTIQTPEQVAASVMAAYKKQQREVMVGFPFKLLNSLYNMFGINVFAM